MHNIHENSVFVVAWERVAQVPKYPIIKEEEEGGALFKAAIII